MKLNKKLDHINIIVPDVGKSIKWYCEHLGFKPAGHFVGAGLDIYYIDNGEVVYELFEDKSLTQPVFDHIAYISDNIQEDFDHYKSQGLNPTPINFLDFLGENGVYYFFIEGPSGEKIELLQKA